MKHRVGAAKTSNGFKRTNKQATASTGIPPGLAAFPSFRSSIDVYISSLSGFSQLIHNFISAV